MAKVIYTCLQKMQAYQGFYVVNMAVGLMDNSSSYPQGPQPLLRLLSITFLTRYR